MLPTKPITYFRILDIRTGDPVTAVAHMSHEYDFANWLQAKHWRRLTVPFENASFFLERCQRDWRGFVLLETYLLDVAGFEQVTGRVVEDTAVYEARELAGEVVSVVLPVGGKE
jgi:hypothetical protein